MNESSASSIATNIRDIAEQQYNFDLYQLIIVLLVIFFAVSAFYFCEKLLKAGHDSTAVMRSIGVISIIFSSVLLIILGYSKEQINVVLALFGTIAGYLLGKSDSQKESEPSTIEKNRRTQNKNE
jgi:uncharacterized membrane protein